MDVILLERINRLGNIGDVVKVRDGYARNFLIPRKKVLRATPANQTIFEERRAIVEQENARKCTEAQEVANTLEGLVLFLIRQAGEDERLYGSVSTKEIVEEIKTAKGLKVDSHDIILAERIKNLGVYDIAVHLHPEVQVNVKLVVARNEAAAKKTLENMQKLKALEVETEEAAS